MDVAFIDFCSSQLQLKRSLSLKALLLLLIPTLHIIYFFAEGQIFDSSGMGASCGSKSELMI